MDRNKIRNLAQQVLSFKGVFCQGDIRDFSDYLTHELPKAAKELEDDAKESEKDGIDLNTPELKEIHYDTYREIAQYYRAPQVATILENIANTDRALTAGNKMVLEEGRQLIDSFVEMLSGSYQYELDLLHDDEKIKEAFGSAVTSLDDFKKGLEARAREGQEKISDFTALRELYSQLMDELGIKRTGREGRG